MWTSGFYRYEHFICLVKQEFQNVLDKNLGNCFGRRQFLDIYYKNVEHGIEHDVDCAYGVCVH